MSNLSWLQKLLLAHGALPYYPGKWFVGVTAWKCFPDVTDFDAIVRREGFTLHVDCRSNWFSRYIAFHGVYEKSELHAVKRFVKPGHCALDIGSNFGYYALWFGRLAGVEGEVHAFEPFPETYERLKENIELNDMSWVRPWQLALSSCTGPQAGVRGRYSGWAHIAAPGENEIEAVPLTGMTLDDFAAAHLDRKIDFIKIDVEGFEPAVLRGGEKTIRRDRPAMMLELNPVGLQRYGSSPEELESLLHSWDYCLYVPEKREIRPLVLSSDWSLLPANTIVLPAEYDRGQ